MPVLLKDTSGVLFIHIPKTGGSAIEKHFTGAGWQMLYHDGSAGKRSINHYHWTTPQHMHANMLEHNFRLNHFDVIFAVVRDPIARFRSEYVWRNGEEMNPRGGGVDPSAKAVEQWADNVFAQYAKNPFALGNHIRPQAEYIVDKARVFRYEDGLDNVIAMLNEEPGLGLPPELPKERTSTESGLSSKDVEISGRLKRKLKTFYAEDFKRFRY